MLRSNTNSKRKVSHAALTFQIGIRGWMLTSNRFGTNITLCFGSEKFSLQSDNRYFCSLARWWPCVSKRVSLGTGKLSFLPSPRPRDTNQERTTITSTVSTKYGKNYVEHGQRKNLWIQTQNMVSLFHYPNKRPRYPNIGERNTKRVSKSNFCPLLPTLLADENRASHLLVQLGFVRCQPTVITCRVVRACSRGSRHLREEQDHT